MDDQKTFSNYAIAMPSSFTWIMAALFFLIYSFDLIDYIESNENIILLADSGLLILVMMLILALVGLYLTGYLIDKKPSRIPIFVILGMVGCSLLILLGLYAIYNENGILVSIAIILVGLFMGISITASGALFGGFIKWHHRGRIFSISILLFSFISICTILITGAAGWEFWGASIFIAVYGLLISLIFIIKTLLTKQKLKYWENDEWPTKFQAITRRRSVQNYLLSHFFIYLMLGLEISSISNMGITLNLSQIVNLPLLGSFTLDADKIFWFTVILGDLIGIIPSGIIADKIGRRIPAVLSIYGVLFASLIFGIDQNFVTFVITAFITGLSFSLIHTTLDSSIWADLAPKDAVGRYYALSFISLTLGLGLGFAVGYWFLPEIIMINILFIIALAILSMLPLFFVTDSLPPLELYLLLVMDKGGSPVFSHDYGREIKKLKVELPLISGALTAVSSFMGEIIDKKSKLSLVKHGHYFILSESKEGLNAVIFTNKNDPEINDLLKEFLKEFTDEYKERVDKWTGNEHEFSEAKHLAERIFGPLISY